MIDAVGDATKLYEAIDECKKDSFLRHRMSEQEQRTLTIAIMTNYILDSYREGYRVAKDFYQDKPAGWGKSQPAVEQPNLKAPSHIIGHDPLKDNCPECTHNGLDGRVSLCEDHYDEHLGTHRGSRDEDV